MVWLYMFIYCTAVNGVKELDQTDVASVAAGAKQLSDHPVLITDTMNNMSIPMFVRQVPT
jgi:hypothetical protein